MSHVPHARVEACYQAALRALMKERHPDGYWVGELSTSALSTATAVMALHLAGQRPDLVAGGLHWLAKHQNADGGFGDTTISLSNISTTMLCRAAFYLTRSQVQHRTAVDRLEAWLFSRYGRTPRELAEAVRKRYGKDRTFAVPILTTCALAGLVEWREVPPLPFELACFPQSWFRFLKLHVVSYALPALIAIGQCVYFHKKPWNPYSLLVRAIARKSSLKVLRAIQPTSGGYLEATPLTSFVCLSLAASGLKDHDVTREGTRFLIDSVRPDGSWPIDTNLSTWVTTLSINAIAAAGEKIPQSEQVRDWLLAQQYRERHPYTGADPGGWAWTPLPGGVPDADDTPGALLALSHLYTLCGPPPAIAENATSIDHAFPPEFAVHIKGMKWLSSLQNSDGGWPTFCRGWGHLPFDRSGCDLTAHAMRVLRVGPSEPIQRGFAFLAKHQRPDGSWLPLWFGNQHAPDDENPTYGTARVLAAYRDLERIDDACAQRGMRWLLSVQNPDGGWGGAKSTPSSIEETSLAVEVLVDFGPDAQTAAAQGVAWLCDAIEAGGLSKPTPIGFYFAKLWYYEKLYPIIFAVAALGRARPTLR